MKHLFFNLKIFIMNTNQIIENTHFLFLLILSTVFVLSSCSKEENPVPELGKWNLVEQLIIDRGGDLKWISVDDTTLGIEFLEEDVFQGGLCMSNCIELGNSTYNSTNQIIEIDFGDECGICIFSYKIEDEFLLLKQDSDEHFDEKYSKVKE